MINIRHGQWETNSSAIHQLVIPLKDDIEPKIKELTIRFVDNPLNGYWRDRNKVDSPQEKLDIIVGAIANDEYNEQPSIYAIYEMMNLIDILKKNGIEVKIDRESFRRSYQDYSLSSEIVDIIRRMVRKRNEKLLLQFIFNDNSFYASDDNNYQENPYSRARSPLVEEESTSGKYVVTDYV